MKIYLRKIMAIIAVMLFMFVLSPSAVHAAGGVSVSCGSGTVDVKKTITCTITLNKGSTGLAVNYSISDTSMLGSGSKITTNKGSLSGDVPGSKDINSGRIDIYADEGISSAVKVVVIKYVVGNRAGSFNFKVTGEYSDDAYAPHDFNKTVKITVNTTTTTKTVTRDPGTSKKTTQPKTSDPGGAKPTNITLYPPSSEVPITNTNTNPGGHTQPSNVTTRDVNNNYIDPDPNHTTSIDANGVVHYQTTGSDGSYTRIVNQTSTVYRSTNQQARPTTRAGGQGPGGSGTQGTKTATNKQNGGSIFDQLFNSETKPTKFYAPHNYAYQQGMENAAIWETTKKRETSFGLTGVKVLTNDGYATVYEIDGVYYATVDSRYEVVEISATAKGDAVIFGTGKRTLTVGRNLVELRVSSPSLNDVLVYQLIIIRDDDSGVHDTSLRHLEVVGFDIDFDSTITEYTLYVPYTMTKFYVSAQPNNEDNIVLGQGIYSLNKANKDNIVYVSCSYGDIQTTQYAIHIKRTYKSIIPWIIVGILLAALIGIVVYMQLSKKKLKSDMTAEKDKEVVAAKKRALVNQQVMPNMKVNGYNTNDVGRRTVVPTSVNPGAPQPQAPGQPLQTSVAPGTPRRPISAQESANVMDHKVKPKYVVPQPVAPQTPPAGNPQVKTIRTVPTNEAGPYREESVVVTQLNK